MQDNNHDNELNVILEKPPAWLIRYGLTYFLGLIIVSGVFCWYFRMPESVNSEIVITAKNSTKSIIAKVPGRISFSVKENTEVETGQVLGFIYQGTKPLLEINALFVHFDSLFSEKEELYNKNITLDESLMMEELQVYYDDFLKRRREYFMFTKLQVQQEHEKRLLNKIKYNRRLLEQTNIRCQVLHEKYNIEKKRFDNAEYLFKENTISKAELQNAQESLLNKSDVIESEKVKLIQTEMSIIEMQDQIKELKLERISDSILVTKAVLDAYKLFYGQLKQWDNSHVLRAPINGALHYINHWSNGQTIKEGEEVMSVVPNNEGMFAFAIVPALRSGEIKSGQNVKISLKNYTVQEHGTITGVVSDVSPIAYENRYKVIIDLPKGLTTSYNHTLPLNTTLHGSAEIILNNTRIVEKMFYHLKSLSDKMSSNL